MYVIFLHVQTLKLDYSTIKWLLEWKGVQLKQRDGSRDNSGQKNPLLKPVSLLVSVLCPTEELGNR